MKMSSYYHSDTPYYSNYSYQSFGEESTNYNNYQQTQYQEIQTNYAQQPNYQYDTNYNSQNNVQYMNYYNNQTTEFYSNQSNTSEQYQWQNEYNQLSVAQPNYSPNEYTNNYYESSTTQTDYSSIDYQPNEYIQQNQYQQQIEQAVVMPNTSDSTKERCCVCEGDKTVKFIYGGILDEACQKFFERCIKKEADGEKFVCKNGGKCLITADKRSCMACRYKKCLSLNLSKTNKRESLENVSMGPCRVCEKVSAGIHFGVVTCEACKVNYLCILILSLD
jgi:hypothetical protein